MMELEKKELVSIVTPVFNGESCIEHCYQSICNQTYKNIEWIVVNDGSEDRTLEKLNELKVDGFKIKIINQENAGCTKARQKGINAANGEYILYLDADDTISNDAIEKAIKKMVDDVDQVLFKKIISNMNNKEEFEFFTNSWPQSGSKVFKNCIDTWGAHCHGLYKRKIFLESYSEFKRLGETDNTVNAEEVVVRIVFLKSRQVDICNGKYFYNITEESNTVRFNKEYYLINRNVFLIRKLLLCKNLSFCSELNNLYSNTFYDLLIRFCHWFGRLNNKRKWLGVLVGLASFYSVKVGYKYDINKKKRLRQILKYLILSLFKIMALFFRSGDHITQYD